MFINSNEGKTSLSKNKVNIQEDTKNKNNVQAIKESNTLDNKHRTMVKKFQSQKNNLIELNNELEKINKNLLNLEEIKEQIIKDDKTGRLTNNDYIKQRAVLLDQKEKLEYDIKTINNNFDEMDYYDNAGDIIVEYYQIRDNETDDKKVKNILSFLGKKKETIVSTETKTLSRAQLFDKYCQKIEGVRVNQDDGSNRIKYCNECNVEKILHVPESAYICPSCGSHENIILDEDKQIKDYSPYRKLNHFREWLNQFQAKQSPDIPDNVYEDIIKEINKNRITDFMLIKPKNMINILRKLGYNNYYEHRNYIIHKLSGLPPPKITRDMEKIFIKMFIDIQDPWEKHKKAERKNFLSYSYVLHKFCELLELDDLLECFPLHKHPDKLIENDEIWKKICADLSWQYISSFK